MHFGDINVTGTPIHGHRIQGWLDGSTQARITWDDARPEAPEEWHRYSAVLDFDLLALQTLFDIDGLDNVCLAAAVLEPIGTAEAQARENRQ